jgi:hypothetical protein
VPEPIFDCRGVCARPRNGHTVDAKTVLAVSLQAGLQDLARYGSLDAVVAFIERRLGG